LVASGNCANRFWQWSRKASTLLSSSNIRAQASTLPAELMAQIPCDANALIAQQLATSVTDDLITPAAQRAMELAFAGLQKGLDSVINAVLKQIQGAETLQLRIIGF
jgi:hypothetical protein